MTPIAARITISIPFWSDFNLGNFETENGEVNISIPFWSDFNLFFYILSAKKIDFNPILVWF